MRRAKELVGSRRAVCRRLGAGRAVLAGDWGEVEERKGASHRLPLYPESVFQ